MLKATGTLRLTRWVTVAIVLAIALLGSSLLLSLVVRDSFHQETKRTIEEMPGTSFKVSIKHDKVVALMPDLRLLPEAVPGVTNVARVSNRGVLPDQERFNRGAMETWPGITYHAVEPTYFSIKGLVLAEGRLYDAADPPLVAVIGARLAEKGKHEVGDAFMRPDMSDKYRIVGILKSFDNQIDETFFTPLEGIPDLIPRGMMIRPSWMEVWVGVEKGYNMEQAMSATAAYIESLPGAAIDTMRPDSPFRIMHEYVAEQTSRSLENMGAIVMAVGALSISGLMLMHVLLGAKALGIRRALGANRWRLAGEALAGFAGLSFFGLLLALLLFFLSLGPVGRFLGTQLKVVPKSLLPGLLAIVALAPACGLVPVIAAGRVSPLDIISDRLNWGLGKKKLDLRQIIVSLAFAAAVGTMFLVTSMGLATLENINATLGGLNEYLVQVSEPPAGTVSPLPTLNLKDYEGLQTMEIQALGDSAWLAHTEIAMAADPDNPLRSDVLAVKGPLLSVREQDLAEGAWLRGRREAVIGSELAVRLYGDESPLGQTILLGNDFSTFTISGVLAPRPGRFIDYDHDRNNAVYINWEDHRLAAPSAQYTPQIFFRATDTEDTERALAIIGDLLRDSNPEGELLLITKPQEALMATRHLLQVFGLATSLMGFITVIAACTSVAALTLIQAREMQKLLALFRACGATKGETIGRILKEALTLVLAGGVIGLILAQIFFRGWAATRNLPALGGWTMVLAGFAGSLLAALLAAAGPAWHVAGRPPAELLD